MQWKLKELEHELTQDRRRRIVFVEGKTDIIFWRELIPDEDRGDTTFYPISTVECPAVEGGTRGKLLWCAEAFRNGAHRERALFFSDADNEKALGFQAAINVVFTDGRDLESYCLTKKILKKIGGAFGKSESYSNAIYGWIVSITKPMGYLRIADARRAWRLPFQAALEGTLDKVLTGKQTSAVLNRKKLILLLMQKGQIHGQQAPQFEQAWQAEEANLIALSPNDVIQGKDFTKALAFVLDATPEEASRTLLLSFDYNDLLNRPAISKVRNWAIGSPLVQMPNTDHDADIAVTKPSPSMIKRVLMHCKLIFRILALR